MQCISESMTTRRVADAIQAAGCGVVEESPARWSIRPSANSRMSIDARLEDDWLLLRAGVCGGHIHGQAVAASAWELLGVNGELGLVKLAAAPGAALVELAGEIAIGDHVDLARRVREICDGMADAAARMRGRPLKAPVGGEEGPVDAAALVAECGWPSVQRAGGRLAIRLETHIGFHEAMVEPAGASLRVGVDIPLADQVSETSRRALGVVLLAAGGLWRLVRPTVRRQDEQWLAVLQSPMGRGPTPRELSQSLAALSIATRRLAREIASLCDEKLAREYLELRGWSSR